MSSANIYSAFRCHDHIVVLHQRGLESPRTVTIFQAPMIMTIHDNKLVGIFAHSHQAVTLVDDPEHSAHGILDAVNKMLSPHNTTFARCWKTIAAFIAGTLLASSAWHFSQTNILVTEATNTEMTVPTVTTPPRQTITAKEVAPATTSFTKQLSLNEMNEVMKINRGQLPTSPNAALQSPTAQRATTATNSSSPEAVLAQQIRTVQNSAGEPSARVQMAKVLKRTADRGMFTITLSSGHERTLYAFLDPNCPNCVKIEPTIERLAQDFNVVVFPVSVSSGENTVAKIIPLLCQESPEKRAAGWRNLFRTDAGMIVPGANGDEDATPDTDCQKSAAAVVAVNNTGFLKFGFAGTPWVLTDTGYHLPTGLLEPATVSLFLKTTDSDSKE